MQVLLITSEPLYPQNTHSSIFEIAQARALKEQDIDACILSVLLVTTKSLIISMAYKMMGRSSVNVNASRFSIPYMIRLWLSSVRNQDKVIVYKHIIEGVEVYEAVGFRPHHISTIEEHLPFWKAAGKKGFERYISEKGKPALIHAHSRFLYAPYLANEIKNETGIPYVVTEHSSHILRNKVNEVLKPIAKNAYANASRIIAVSHAVSKKLQQDFDATDIVIIPNMLDVLYQESLQGKKKDSFRILAIGTLDNNKNQSLLVDAIAQFSEKPFTVEIVGDGPDREMLKDKIEKKGLGQTIKLTGNLPKAKVRQKYAEADVLVVTSNVETFSVVTIEALASGIPVISTRCGGPEDIITPSTGILIEKNDVAGLYRALNLLVSGELKFDAKTLRQYALSKYSGHPVAKQLIETYQTIINRSLN